MWNDVRKLLPGYDVDKNDILVYLESEELHILGNRDILDTWLSKDKKPTSITHWQVIEPPKLF